MRRTLSIIIIYLLLSSSCVSYKGFQEITNVNVEAYPTRNISIKLDTLDKRVTKIWNKLKNDEKKDFMSKIEDSRIERIKDIKADTSEITRIYLSGNEDHVVFYGKDRNDLTNLSARYEELDFYFESCDSIYKKIEIGTLDRNTGVNKVKIRYPDLKRFAILDLDTRYSSIHIFASSIRQKLELENDSLRAGVKRDSIPPLPDFIEVVNEEGIYIYYEIPKRKYR